jgi:hypothetical protein
MPGVPTEMSLFNISKYVFESGMLIEGLGVGLNGIYKFSCYLL